MRKRPQFHRLKVSLGRRNYIEEFDPDPFMEMLNEYGLPWVVEENPEVVR